MYVMILVTLIIAPLLAFFLSWMYMKKKNIHGIPIIKGGIPIFGHILSLPNRSDRIKTFKKWKDEYGSTHAFWFFHHIVVFCTDPIVLADLLSSQKVLKKASTYWTLKEIIGDGLVVSDGDLWKQRRRIITPTFHFNILGDYFSIIKTHTEEFVSKLHNYAISKDEFNIFPVAKQHSLNIICETAMGVDMRNDSAIQKYDQWLNAIFDQVVTRGRKPWLWKPWVFKLTQNGKDYFKALGNMRNFVKDIIERRIEMRNSSLSNESVQINSCKNRIFLDTILDAYQTGDIDVDGMIDEVNTFVIAGLETVSTAISWCLYLLALNRDVQEKAREEVLRIENLYDTNCFDVLKEMKYIDCVVKESLRMHPSVPAIGRLIEKDTEIGGKIFPRCNIVVNLLLLHRNPEIWENPMSFTPERFENLNEKQTQAYSFIPFSAGPRNCIGQRFAMMELKLAIYHILKNFDVTTTQKESDVVETANVSHGSETGLMLRLEKRQ